MMTMPPMPAKRSNGEAMIVRDAVAADHAAILALNNSAVPHVNALSMEDLAWLSGHANFFRVVTDAEGVLGFALVLPSGGAYWSDNYKWFSARYDRFVYLDRVVVAERARRRGVGRALYAALFAFAQREWPRVALEVNRRPANPDSEAFHAALGFATVGVREYNNGENAVVMMVRETSV